MNLFKNIVTIHPLFYLFIIIALLTGYFKDLLLIMSIITIHELGHVLTALYYKWNILEIKVLPFGGITIFSEDINRPIKEELTILLMGPIFQITSYLIINSYLNSSLYSNYHYFILLFNLLPIIPLDGSKLINLIGDYILPFYKSYKYNVYISIISLIIIIIYIFTNSFNFICYIILLFLIIEVLKNNNRKELVFNRFILERYQKRYIFKKHRIIRNKNIKEMKRDYTHLFYIKNKCITEREIISKKFDFKR